MLWIPALLLTGGVAVRDTTPDACATTGTLPGSVFVTLGEAPPADSAHTADGFCAWGMELRLGAAAAAPASAPPTARPAAVRGPMAELRLTRTLAIGSGADAATIARARTTGRRLPTLTVDVPTGAGRAVRVQLAGVTVVAQRIVSPTGTDDLDAQLTTRSAELVQLEADRNDAARRLTELQALDQRKLAAGFEVARAGDRVRVLDARLAAAREQLTRARARAGRAATALEELTFAAERADVVER